jgi:diacylglycerol kinase
MSKKHSIVKSFPYALDGLKTAFKNEPNFRVHLIIGFLTLVTAFFLKVNPTNLAILVLTIGLVITLELLNTMIEALVDLVSPNIHPLAKIAKDVSAAAVLISTMVSIIIGLLIFGEQLLF